MNYVPTLHHLPKIWVVIANDFQATTYHLATIQRRMPMFGNHHAYNPAHSALKLIPVEGGKLRDGHSFFSGHHPIGRIFKPFGRLRHGVPDINHVEHERKVRFVRQIIGYLQSEHMQKSFDQLIIAAPPKMLGMLRAEMPPSLSDCISGVASHDLTHYRLPKALRHLEDFLPSVG